MQALWSQSDRHNPLDPGFPVRGSSPQRQPCRHWSHGRTLGGSKIASAGCHQPAWRIHTTQHPCIKHSAIKHAGCQATHHATPASDMDKRDQSTCRKLGHFAPTVATSRSCEVTISETQMTLCTAQCTEHRHRTLRMSVIVRLVKEEQPSNSDKMPASVTLLQRDMSTVSSAAHPGGREPRACIPRSVSNGQS